jgi:hypothetical protein
MPGKDLIVEKKKAFRSRDGPTREIGFVGCSVQLKTLGCTQWVPAPL